MSGVRRQVVVSTLSLQGLLGSKGGMEGGGAVGSRVGVFRATHRSICCVPCVFTCHLVNLS